VAVPDAQRVGKLGEEFRFVSSVFDIEDGAAIFTAFGRFDFSAEMVGEPLHAVADSEDGDAEREYVDVTFGSLGIVDGAGAAGKHDAGRFELADFVERGGTWENGGEDLLFANPASDELSVLAAEV
jgi:hypothetical protein